MYLERISSPDDVLALPASALPSLAAEIRSAIVESTSVTGGHTGSNLATVELAIALQTTGSSSFFFMGLHAFPARVKSS